MSGHGSTAERVYLALARRLLPAALYAEAETELLEVFRDGRAAALARGAFAIFAFWPRMLADLLVTAQAERRASRRGRNVRRGRWTLDARAAVREIRRSPVAAAASVGTLGLGIAATVLLLVLVRGVLMAPLPFDRPDRLVRLLEVSDEGIAYWPSWPNIADWREQATVLESVIAADIGAVRPVIIGDGARRVAIGRVSRDFFRTLGVTPVAGRDLRADENRPGGPAVALVSEEMWRGTLGAAPLETLRLELGADDYEVVGVIPTGFRFLGNGNAWLAADVWLPLERSPALGGRGTHGYHTIGRVRDEVELATARAALEALYATMKRQHGNAMSADRLGVEALSQAVVKGIERPLHLLLVAAFAVLAVSCLNLGAGLLARGLTRERDLAVRTALGARRGDLVRLQLGHAAMLAVPGALAGTFAAWLALDVIQMWAGAAVPRLDEVTLDPMAVLTATAVALLTAITAGLVPAVSLSTRADVAERLRTHGVSNHGRAHRALWDAFVAGQVALTLALLVSAALLARSLAAALDVDLGYRTDGVLIAAVALPESRYAEPERRVAYYDALLDRLRASAGVDAAGLVSVPPDEVTTFTGGTRREGVEQGVWGGFRLADAGYFETVEIPVEQGSFSQAQDAVLIDRFLADELWKDAPPVGGRISAPILGETVDVAGVVGPVRTWNQTRGIGAMYMHYARRPEWLLSMYIVARGPDRAAVARSLREAAAATDPLAPMDIEPLRERVDASMADRRLMLAIALGFALCTLLLATAGVHALVAQAAARRRHETGIRLILGARPARIRRRVVALGLRAVLAGIAIGAAVSWVAVRTLRSQLFGVTPTDPVALGVAAASLFGAAALAAWLPARTATRVDPVRLLREE